MLKRSDSIISALKSWRQKFPQTSPPARDNYGMAYDAAHQQVVLFGGCCQNGFLADTWLWDGTTWTKKSPGNDPPAHAFHAMAYDEARQQVVMFGGLGATIGPFLSDTWVWDGSNWTLKSTGGPDPRDDFALAYDAARQQVVLFGGSTFSDTWVWDGSNWTRKAPQTSPPPRGSNAMAYDAARQQVDGPQNPVVGHVKIGQSIDPGQPQLHAQHASTRGRDLGTERWISRISTR